MTELRQRMLDELQRRNFAPSTIRYYIMLRDQRLATSATGEGASIADSHTRSMMDRETSAFRSRSG